MQIAWLGLGSNIGDKEENLLRAISFIKRKMKILDYSSVYSTPPMGYTNQSNFLNMVIKVDLEKITPLELLSILKSIEKYMGRKKTFRWGPRIIDIDILYIEGVRLETEKLSIPHKEMLNRGFVLIPISEISEKIIINDKSISIKSLIDENMRNGITLYKKREIISINEKT